MSARALAWGLTALLLGCMDTTKVSLGGHPQEPVDAPDAAQGTDMEMPDDAVDEGEGEGDNEGEDDEAAEPEDPESEEDEAAEPEDPESGDQEGDQGDEG